MGARPWLQETDPIQTLYVSSLLVPTNLSKFRVKFWFVFRRVATKGARSSYLLCDREVLCM
jgi:hypothetical protein